jgi:hypothetical protein
VAGDHARAPGGGADQRLDQLGGVRVEVGGGLVEQQQLGVVEDRARDRRALDHPARVGVHRVVGARGQADGLQQLVDPRGGRAVQPRVEGEVLARGQVAVQQRGVTQEADVAADRPAGVGQLVAQDPRRAAVGAQQRGQHAQQRGLAGAVGAEDDQRGAGVEREADAGEGLAVAVAPRQAVELNGWCCHGRAGAYGLRAPARAPPRGTAARRPSGCRGS